LRVNDLLKTGNCCLQQWS